MPRSIRASASKTTCVSHDCTGRRFSQRPLLASHIDWHGIVDCFLYHEFVARHVLFRRASPTDGHSSGLGLCRLWCCLRPDGRHSQSAVSALSRVRTHYMRASRLWGVAAVPSGLHMSHRRALKCSCMYKIARGRGCSVAPCAFDDGAVFL